MASTRVEEALYTTAQPRLDARRGDHASSQVIGVTAMQLFVAAIGAGGQVRRMARSGSWLVAFSAVSLAGHAAVLGLARRVFRIPVRELAVASNAAVGGPTTAASMAAAKNWDSLAGAGAEASSARVASAVEQARGVRRGACHLDARRGSLAGAPGAPRGHPGLRDRDLHIDRDHAAPRVGRGQKDGCVMW